MPQWCFPSRTALLQKFVASRTPQPITRLTILTSTSRSLFTAAIRSFAGLPPNLLSSTELKRTIVRRSPWTLCLSQRGNKFLSIAPHSWRVNRERNISRHPVQVLGKPSSSNFKALYCHTLRNASRAFLILTELLYCAIWVHGRVPRVPT